MTFDSSKRDYAPLLECGFRQIADWQLDSCFLEPFREQEKERRLRLISQLQKFLSELEKLGISLEVWIDGSFATTKPEPEDVDVVVWVDESEAELLSPERLKLFDYLLSINNHDLVNVRYDVDVHLADRNSPSAREKWQNEFGFDRVGLTQKGIFKLLINHV